MSDQEPAKSAFAACADFIQEADQVLRLSVRGIMSVSKSGALVEAVERHDHSGEDGKLATEAQERVDRAHQEATLAESEIAKDFPLLHAHAAVAHWSALESTFPRYAVYWLQEHPEILSGPEFEKIRVPVALYENYERDERMEYIVEELLQIVRYQHLPGVGRFEALLAPLGLGGAVQEELRKDLFELSQVRNLIVHKFSIVDRRFQTSCPWLEVSVGARFSIGHDDYARYRDATVSYLTEVILRAVEKRDGKRPDSS